MQLRNERPGRLKPLAARRRYFTGENMDYRIEHDSMGDVKVPADRYWAAQTERSRGNFKIGAGIETMPREITSAFGILKKAAAIANHLYDSTRSGDRPRPRAKMTPRLYWLSLMP